MDYAVFEVIREIIAEQTGISAENISPTTILSDNRDIDSIDQVEIIMGVEDAFNIVIPDEVAQKMTAVSDLLKYLDAKSETEVDT